ncbi:exodeoxyribonuclease VII small subunit [Nodosilinea sp. LEGE 07088]|uniref:exodeoxyribonuclease VII small subunit n=1 Tax=Nodosilinea sp. LEGE 07088 TaxID=2777968 RepID=UPI00187FDAB5|nr:exodeoxyribonuclease VII small subunit [Nodosilinea sp. LEGE 07088]MBE9138755.1 exodeoxyribonuclease VII small subunit [Nodosilinea sp. LEGE 07088]
MPKKTNPAAAENWSYENTVANVEGIIADLEAGNLPLATVLAQFEQAVQALQTCEIYLHEKQQQVDLLIETLADE